RCCSRIRPLSVRIPSTRGLGPEPPARRSEAHPHHRRPEPPLAATPPAPRRRATGFTSTDDFLRPRAVAVSVRAAGWDYGRAGCWRLPGVVLAGSGGELGEGGGGEAAAADGLGDVADGGGELPFGGGGFVPAELELAQAHDVLDVAVGCLGDVPALAVAG